jgi:legumain
VTVSNFYASILGDKDAIKGGSGKVVASGPNDHVFIYYTDHGGPGCLGMPNDPILYADEFVDTLKKKAAAGTFKKMVIYLEACESGSIFDGLLPKGLNIYVTTASDPDENSWGTYCPGMENPPPPEFDTCLGDLYSVAWIEDAEIENLKKETLKDQYKIVAKRTSDHDTYMEGSHVMQYGDVEIEAEELEQYLGFDPANENVTKPGLSEPAVRGNVPQREADLLHLWHKYYSGVEGSTRKEQAGMELTRTITQRVHVDNSVKLIGELLFGHENSLPTLQAVRPAGRVLVDDWACLKSMVRTFEASCGPLTQYGMKHMRAFANICNAGVDISAMTTATSQACRIDNMGSGLWTSDASRFNTPV